MYVESICASVGFREVGVYSTHVDACCSSSAAVYRQLLNSRATMLTPAAAAAAAATATAVFCRYGGGKAGMSDTLVGGLWVADALFAFARAGAKGFHLHCKWLLQKKTDHNKYSHCVAGLEAMFAATHKNCQVKLQT
jgi:hypothetical protein